MTHELDYLVSHIQFNYKCNPNTYKYTQLRYRIYCSPWWIHSLSALKLEIYKSIPSSQRTVQSTNNVVQSTIMWKLNQPLRLTIYKTTYLSNHQKAA